VEEGGGEGGWRKGEGKEGGGRGGKEGGGRRVEEEGGRGKRMKVIP
jgi:hypothetical protein